MNSRRASLQEDVGLPDYNAPTSLAALLDEYGYGMQKKFGQNFLINEHIRHELVSALDIAPGALVWEVGPGLGAVTSLLLDRGARLTAFEIDRGFIQLLKTYFGAHSSFHLVEGDVLKTWYAEYQRCAPQAFFGNLPYNIAAKLIAATIEAGCLFEQMVITVQKEVGLRMTALPGTKDYSSFSVLCRWAYNVEVIRDIAAAAFWPEPRVTSRALRFTQKKTRYPLRDTRLFLILVRGLFAARRKTVKNNLEALLATLKTPAPNAQSLLEKASLNPAARAESLTVYDFIRLSDTLAAYHE